MLFIALLIALLVPLSLWTRRFLRIWAPTNILLDRFRDRAGVASAEWSLLIGAIYLAAACALAGLVEQGWPGWLNLLFFLFLWNAAKFSLYGSWMMLVALASSPARIVRRVRAGRAAKREARRRHEGNVEEYAAV